MDNTKDYDIYKKNHDMVESKHHSICENEKKINFNTNVQAQNFNQITTTKLSGLDQDLSETLIDKKQGVKAKWLPTEG